MQNTGYVMIILRWISRYIIVNIKYKKKFPIVM
jgi:hypothetical protein